MRILVISNFYPPYSIGGYEVACQEMVEALAARGHEVRVLCSFYGLSRPQAEGPVFRWLLPDVGPERYVPRPTPPRELFRRELVSRGALRRLAADFDPQVAFVWNLTNVSLSLLGGCRRLGLPLVYYVFDGWLAHWGYDRWRNFWGQTPPGRSARLRRLGLRALAGGLGLPTRVDDLDLRHVQFATAYLKQAAVQAGHPVAQAGVIYYGLRLADFPERGRPAGPPRRLLYVGQVVPHKGVHTAVAALHLLAADPALPEVELTIAGGTTIPQYEAELRQQAAALGLESRVHFTGPIPRERIPAVYREHDILIFPSVWDEPFGITLLEGMASGLAVAATANGGSAEILDPEQNSLVFASEDAAACAAHVRRLLADPALYDRLSRAGRRTVEERFQQARMVDQIEHALWGAVEAGR